MKKTILLFLAMALLLALAACGGKTEAPAPAEEAETAAPAEPEAAEPAPEPEAAEPAPGADYDVGDFTVYVPGGWDAVEVRYAADNTVEPHTINIYKGAEYDEGTQKWDTWGKPHVYIYRYAGDDIDLVPGEKSFWENAEDIADVSIGNFTWQGFTYDQFGENGAILWALAGDYGYQLSIAFQNELTLDDADLQAIIASLE